MWRTAMEAPGDGSHTLEGSGSNEALNVSLKPSKGTV